MQDDLKRQWPSPMISLVVQVPQVFDRMIAIIPLHTTTKSQHWLSLLTNNEDLPSLGDA